MYISTIYVGQVALAQAMRYAMLQTPRRTRATDAPAKARFLRMIARCLRSRR
jgi:hypothetical protein